MNDPNQSIQDKSFRWVKFQQNLSLRRGTVYRFLSSSLQLLLIGNAGGVGLIFGIFPAGQIPETAHWICVSAIILFMLGALTSAATIISVSALSMKEAHAAETAMIELVKEKITLEDAVLLVDQSSYSLAASSMITGIVSLAFLSLGAIAGVALVVIYY